MITRFSLLAGTSMALVLSGALMTSAAPCGVLPGTIDCTAPNSDPVLSDEDGVEVIVRAPASVISDDEDISAIALGGAGTTVRNRGLIEQTDEGGFAVFGDGDGLRVVNAGTITSGDRGIVMEDGSDLTVINREGGLIEARRQAVRAQEDSPGARVVNNGTIISAEGRALQLRSFGATVVNRGMLIGAEEVVEARGDFTLRNFGTIKLSDPAIEDEDGVQFAGGRVRNWGLIEGSDDGIDVDEGRIVNEATGIIRSTAPDENTNSGIDVDEVYDDEVSPERAPGPLTIVNRGLIEGPSAIGTDAASTSEIRVVNSGSLLGRGGTAIRLAENQGDSRLRLFGDSQIFGDVRFGGGNDILRIGDLTSGLLGDGLFDGGAGSNRLIFSSLGLSDFLTFKLNGDQVDLSFLANGDVISGSFLNFNDWRVNGQRYTAASLQDALDLQPVPLPAALPLLLAAFGGLSLLRRRQHS